jgi:predicted amidohydrolase YtcJ
MFARLFALALALFAAVPAEAARTLIVNANGYLMEANGGVRKFAHLFIGEDGRVLATLPAGSAEPKLVAGDFRQDMKGRVLMPGLIDAHGHLMGLGFALRQLDLSGTASLTEAQNLIREAAARSGEWVTGRGWNQVRWGMEAFPTAADLDLVTGAKPGWLVRVDGHAGWANTAALKAAGITRATKDPPGGRIIRDAAGNPTGILIDKAMDLVSARVPAPSALEREKALEAALEHLASVGLTGIHDMGTTPVDWNLFRAFGDEGRLTVRVTAYADGLDTMEVIGPVRPTPWLYQERLRLQGVKLYADGALGSRGAWLKAPYADEPGTGGLRFHDDTRLRNLMSRANFVGYQLAVHAIGDAANAQVLDAYAELLPTYGPTLRNRIEHVQVLDPADFGRFSELSVIASMQPIHATSDRVMAEARLGPDRLSGAYAWRSLRQAGARLAFGSDTPVEPANPFLGIHAAVTRRDAAGNPAGGWRPEERLTLTQAISGFTVDAAHAGKMDGKVGSLGPGAWADFIILDRDPFEIAPDDLPNVRVLETWLAGRRIWVRPEPQGPASRGPGPRP